ncbi:MAG: PD-(D/E)XK nuclease family protein [Acidiphilium sp.]|nr:PD-(D/E)XK nuclease family protein [Acidiphilium sp.]
MSDFIRASSLSGYSDCPRRAAARLFRQEIEAAGYILHETPQGIGASVGTSIHAAAALTLTEKANTGSLAPLSAVTDCAVETYRETVADGVMFDQKTPSSHDAERQIVGMAAAYNRVLAPRIEPIAIEEQLEADTPFGLVLTGRGDVLAREKNRIRDLKCGQKRSNHKPQLGAYSLLYKANGYEVETCAEDFLQRVGSKKPQPDPLTFPHDIAAAETAALSVLRHIASDIRVFREGDPAMGVMPGDPWAFAANPSSMLCHPKYCSAHGTDWCAEHMAKEAE